MDFVLGGRMRHFFPVYVVIIILFLGCAKSKVDYDNIQEALQHPKSVRSLIVTDYADDDLLLKISSMKNIEKLTIQSTNIESLKGIEKLVKLKKLMIIDTPIKSITNELDNLISLKALSISKSSIEKIVFNKQSNLESIWLQKNTALSELNVTNVPYLAKLKVEGNQKVNLVGLENAHLLDYLELHNCFFNSKELFELKELRKLFLYKIDALSLPESINTFPYVDQIIFSDIANVDSGSVINFELECLEDIRFINVNLKGKDINFKTPRLRKLVLSNSKINNIENCLSNLAEHVDVLSLSNISLTKIPKAVFEMRNLMYLYLDNNNISNLDGISHIKTLVYLDIANTKIGTLPKGILDRKNLDLHIGDNKKLISLLKSNGWIFNESASKWFKRYE